MATKTKIKKRTVSAAKAANIIRESSGRFITVDFTKRTDSKLRTMNCRVGVFKGVKGGKRKKKDPGLITVFDMQKKGYRTINVSGLRRVRHNGIDYRVSG